MGITASGSPVARSPDHAAPATEHDMSAVVDGVGVVPQRRSLQAARAELEATGAVIVSGPSADAGALVEVAAKLLGTRLRQLFPIRYQDEEDGNGMDPHNDWGICEADLHGQLVRFRNIDEDYVFLRCAQQARTGGESFVVDGYLLVDRIQRERPGLYRFLTGVDIDFRGAYPTNPPSWWGAPTTALLRRMVEHTRAGRRVVRATNTAAPIPYQPGAEHHQEMLTHYVQMCAAAMAVAPRFVLETGDILALDNYRYLHGREPFSGQRKLQVLNVLSSDAWAGFGW